MSKNHNPNYSILTIRIDNELDRYLSTMKDRLGVSKADLIRNYLELSKYIIKEKKSLKSLNNRDFIILKRSYVRKLIEANEEIEQIKLGDSLARFINDISRINGKIDDLGYKIEMCNNLGYFPKFVDQENYLLVPKEFGPQKFVEAFLWRLFSQKEMNLDYTEDNMKGNKSLRSKYKSDFNVVERSASHYSFEFAKL